MTGTGATVSKQDRAKEREYQRKLADEHRQWLDARTAEQVSLHQEAARLDVEFQKQMRRDPKKAGAIRKRCKEIMERLHKMSLTGASSGIGSKYGWSGKDSGGLTECKVRLGKGLYA